MAATMMNLGVVADKLGRLRAKMKELANQEAELKVELVESGVEVVEGKLFRVTISRHEVERVDYKAIVEKLEPSHQLVSAHTSVEDRTTVKVVARVVE